MSSTSPGDWICRESRSVEQRLAALAQIWSREMNHPFEFGRVSVDREVVVASGEFRLVPPLKDDSKALYMYLDAEELEHLDQDGGGGTRAQSVDGFLRVFGNRVGMPVENRVACMHDFRWET